MTRLASLARRAALGALLAGALAAPAAAQRPAKPLLVTTIRRGGADVGDTATSEFTVGGLRVILRRNTANDVVAANLFLLGGVRQLTPATQGIETFLLEATERGTQHYPGEAVRSRLARMGSTIVIEPDDDFTVFGLRAIRTTFDSTWGVLADRIMAPTLDSSEVELVRTQVVNGLRQGERNPDEALRRLADSLVFTGHPYGLSVTGTAASVQRISLAQLRAYRESQMVTSRMLLVVVGNVERDRVERLVRATLAKLPAGSYRWTQPPDVAPRGGTTAFDRRALPTNYLLGYYVGPRAGTPDYTAMRLATAILSGRLFTEVRSRRNLSYAVEAPFVERAIATGGLYVTTVDPAQTLGIMREELTRLQTETVTPEGLQRLVQQFITDYFMKNETNADQATFLARAALYDGSYRAADDFVEQLRKVTPEDIRGAAMRYMRGFRFAYVGDPSKVTPDMLGRF